MGIQRGVVFWKDIFESRSTLLCLDAIIDEAVLSLLDAVQRVHQQLGRHSRRRHERAVSNQRALGQKLGWERFVGEDMFDCYSLKSISQNNERVKMQRVTGLCNIIAL